MNEFVHFLVDGVGSVVLVLIVISLIGLTVTLISSFVRGEHE